MKRLSTIFAACVMMMFAVNASLAREEANDAAKDESIVGKPAPQFELTDVVTGKTHKLSDFKDKTVVVVFQSINCPWDRMREDGGYQRYLAPLSQSYADKNVVFLAINANRNESVQQVAAYHEKHHIPYPILKDPDNIVADKYNARTTPHVYVIRAGEEQILAYKGGVEEDPPTPEMCGKMETKYLVPVLEAVVNGTELPVTETRSKGCGIKRVSK